VGVDEIWRAFQAEDIGLPMLSSLITGMLIGFERELRAKPAGLRTHTLICFASTLLMLAAVRQSEWTTEFITGGQIVTDPTRMAHGVLTGIGFLCAGVIFREGASIHGLTTAASLWVTSALGVLYGVGLYWLAVSGAVATLVVLILFRVLNAVLPHPLDARLRVVTRLDAETVDATLLQTLVAGVWIRADTTSHALVQGSCRQFAARIRMRDQETLQRLSDALATLPGIVEFSVIPTEDDPAFHSVRA
jgi:putative Mg2+ transporter-C (MgtC) family protein